MAKKPPTLSPIDNFDCQINLPGLLHHATEPFATENRRNIERNPTSLVLVIQPLNDRFEPVGSPFKAVTRDVSEQGLGFIHATPFPTSYVRVGVTAQSKAQSIAQVCYNKTHFSDEMVYLVGVKFISHSMTL